MKQRVAPSEAERGRFRVEQSYATLVRLLKFCPEHQQRRELQSLRAEFSAYEQRLRLVAGRPFISLELLCDIGPAAAEKDRQQALYKQTTSVYDVEGATRTEEITADSFAHDIAWAGSPPMNGVNQARVSAAVTTVGPAAPISVVITTPAAAVVAGLSMVSLDVLLPQHGSTGECVAYGSTTAHPDPPTHIPYESRNARAAQ